MELFETNLVKTQGHFTTYLNKKVGMCVSGIIVGVLYFVGAVG